LLQSGRSLKQGHPRLTGDFSPGFYLSHAVKLLHSRLGFPSTLYGFSVWIIS